MEVFVKGVSERESERNLHDCFENVLRPLGIEDWSCQKLGKKPFAKILFLSPLDGQKFLDRYGYEQKQSTSSGLAIRGKPLYCNKSNKPVDPFGLKNLEMNKRLREETVTVKQQKLKSKKSPLKLACTSISCGIWEYHKSNLCFKSFFTLKESASMTFKSRYILFKTSTGNCVDIPYCIIETVAREGLAVPAITFTLTEAPRIIRRGDDDLVARMADLMGDHLLEGHETENYRSPGLNREHEKVSGSCLVYRVTFANISELYNQREALNRIRAIPSMVQRSISVMELSGRYSTELAAFNELRSPSSTNLPFAIKFQIQRLVQNGYLSPQMGCTLFGVVKDISLRSGPRVCVNAIRRLFRHIPFAGPDTDAEWFSLKNLERMLKGIEDILNRGGIFLEQPVTSESIAIIHKASVTPTGIYLYGPEAESNNRVLRKYSNYHDYFLRVQFCEEDGQPLFFDRKASREPIFDRFRKVLNEGIDIAGRRFSFLGFSHSSLRSQSCWFMAPFFHNGTLLFDRELIKGLGNFSTIQTPAKCAARIGQAFSDTRDAIHLAPGVVKEMPDVGRDGRVFSDGVGTISKQALEEIWAGLLAGKEKKPTVLQIRYQGT
jgi:hypothetical protein